jgi:hypothetical protein
VKFSEVKAPGLSRKGERQQVKRSVSRKENDREGGSVEVRVLKHLRSFFESLRCSGGETHYGFER